MESSPPEISATALRAAPGAAARGLAMGEAGNDMGVPLKIPGEHILAQTMDSGTPWDTGAAAVKALAGGHRRGKKTGPCGPIL
ncbi:hypothetical protein SCL_2544 [Sulfuricaulis limicola]|uniref:Uncharacterized protein n=1 Tax=Sulfuricaulis limicola TaxID=1620215 RepID=A0A1B4XJ64_9GAMM|nr:hypothetical protein SCL_2544 [Sulfuricaulis limicola]